MLPRQCAVECSRFSQSLNVAIEKGLRQFDCRQKTSQIARIMGEHYGCSVPRVTCPELLFEPSPFFFLLGLGLNATCERGGMWESE